MERPPDDEPRPGTDYASLGRPGETFWSEHWRSLLGVFGSLVVAVVAYQMGQDPYEDFPILAKIVIGLAGVSVIVFAYLGVRKTVAETTVGEVDVTWEPHDLHYGDVMQVDVRFQPESSGTLAGCHLTLVATYLPRRDTQQRGFDPREVAYEHELTLEGSRDRRFTEGEWVEMSTELQIPHAAEIEAGAHTWKLTTHLELEMFPDWKDTWELVVEE